MCIYTYYGECRREACVLRGVCLPNKLVDGIIILLHHSFYGVYSLNSHHYFSIITDWFFLPRCFSHSVFSPIPLFFFFLFFCSARDSWLTETGWKRVWQTVCEGIQAVREEEEGRQRMVDCQRVLYYVFLLCAYQSMSILCCFVFLFSLPPTLPLELCRQPEP